ncbi:uncharacterized protein TM35_000011200 [Trypanosoma theileri]|uniref:Methyltransferase domain-containing protein n=1 Tax=Trypanosoma theileri TaxID=67003 RepID=A0A1X0P9D5_9TRYP|nr:uncharacterized protein TM35_000011200 [Trypanosoma theileri]ORC93243.1 hypothetical protein TM35_000011200 [Trypanosoma theileri]
MLLPRRQFCAVGMYASCRLHSLMLCPKQHQRCSYHHSHRSPVVCRGVGECQQHIRLLRQEMGGARTLLAVHEAAVRFVAAVHTTVLFPRDVVGGVEDFAARLARAHAELTAVEEFGAWLQAAVPPTAEFISAAELTRLVLSFGRYHRGVRWGGEWHRGGYLLHPWHNTYCPATHAEQMPYVHLLQWMLHTKPRRHNTSQHINTNNEDTNDCGGLLNEPFSSRDEAMRIWNALETFTPPSWKNAASTGSNTGFTALDCGCHSGYMTDLLLKAGAHHIVGVDVSKHTLGSAEATVHEHLQERRSTGHVAKRVHFMRCDILPEWETVAPKENGGTPLKESVLTVAAKRRRREARQHNIAVDPDSVEKEKNFDPVDFLVFHPPAKPLFPSWPSLEDAFNSRDFAGSDLGISHPHSSLPVLREILQQLLFVSSNEMDNSSSRQHRRKIPLIKEGGYVAFILPRTFDPKSILEYTSLEPLLDSGGFGVTPVMPLGDVVVTTLEGSYELVLRRRYSLKEMLDDSEATHRQDMRYIRAFAHPQFHKRIERELQDFYKVHQMIDLLVLRKKKLSKNTDTFYNGDHNNVNEKSHSNNGRTTEPLQYEESFEFTEYIPANAPSPAHHWTEVTPSYSYLEEEFFGGNKVITASGLEKGTISTPGVTHEQNFLAVGHTIPPMRRNNLHGDDELSQSELHTVRRNLQNYRNLFAKELKEKRSGRLRKMALQPLDKQEWYIDEKLVKSESAKVDLMNELSRFDMQDWD